MSCCPAVLCQTFPTLQSSPSALGWSEGFLAQQQPPTGLLTHLICALLAARSFPGISCILLEKCTVFHVCLVGGKALLLQNEGHHKCLTLTWLAQSKQSHRSSVVSAQTHVFLSSPGRAQPSLCPGVCVLELAKYWKIPRCGLKTKSETGSSPLGSVITPFDIFWCRRQLILRTIYWDSYQEPKSCGGSFVSKAISRVGALERHG